MGELFPDFSDAIASTALHCWTYPRTVGQLCFDRMPALTTSASSVRNVAMCPLSVEYNRGFECRQQPGPFRGRCGAAADHESSGVFIFVSNDSMIEECPLNSKQGGIRLFIAG